jgi:superfamily II DNA helicase RecQ
MEMKIRENNGTFKVTVTSLAGRELAVYSEVSGRLTFELREIEEQEEVNALGLWEENALEFERVPMFKEEEREAVTEETVAAQEEHAAIMREAKTLARKAEVCATFTAQGYTQEEAELGARLNEMNEVAHNNALFHKLSSLRRELASAENVPPYMVFHDKTLWCMVEKKPFDLPELGKISGVGKAKLEKYGAKFLSALQESA